MDRIDLLVGDQVRLTMPWSEVVMHLRLADQAVEIEVLDGGMAQIWRDGRTVSFPVTWGEAGIYSGGTSGPYTYGGQLVDGPSRSGGGQ